MRAQCCILAGVVSVLCVGVMPLDAQVERRDVPLAAQPQQRFDSGQDIQPIYEGWERHEDGSISLHFGYLNRNYREQPTVTVGALNYFSPGDVDRGQPTFFYPRTHRFEFSVRVAADMGSRVEDGLVWTVVHNGSEQRAIAWLQPEWEIDEDTIIKNTGIGFGRPKSEWFANKSPRLTVTSDRQTARVGVPIELVAVLSDDELPRRIGGRLVTAQDTGTSVSPTGRSLTDVPTLRPPEGAPLVPDNIQWYRRPRPPRNGLSVLWVVYRGKDSVSFAPSDYQRAFGEDEREPEGTQARRYPSIGPRNHLSTAVAGDGWMNATFTTVATFGEAGTYQLRAHGSDGMRVVSADLTLLVE